VLFVSRVVTLIKKERLAAFRESTLRDFLSDASLELSACQTISIDHLTQLESITSAWLFS
jgi:hypothetical protein